MQTSLRTAGLQSAGRAQLPRVQRGCQPLRASTIDNASQKDQSSLALATLLASSVVAVSSAHPALADEVAIATVAAPSVEVSFDVTDGVAELYEAIPSAVAPALTEEFAVAPDADALAFIGITLDSDGPVAADDFTFAVATTTTTTIAPEEPALVVAAAPAGLQDAEDTPLAPEAVEDFTFAALPAISEEPALIVAAAPADVDVVEVVAVAAPEAAAPEDVTFAAAAPAEEQPVLLVAAAPAEEAAPVAVLEAVAVAEVEAAPAPVVAVIEVVEEQVIPVAEEPVAQAVEVVEAEAASAPAVAEAEELAAVVAEAAPVVPEEPAAAVVEELVEAAAAAPVEEAAPAPVVAEAEPVTAVEEAAVAAAEEPVVAVVEEPAVAAAEEPVVAASEEPIVAAAEEPVAPAPVVAEAVPVEEVAEPAEVVVVEETTAPIEEVAVPVVAAAATPAVEEPAPAATAPSSSSSKSSSSSFDLSKLLAGITASVPRAASASSSSSASTAETATYGALGAAALAFVGTFFVAPRFRDSFKEPVDWKEMYAALKGKGVKTISPEEAYGKAKKGAVILDVRLADKFAARSAAGSVNVPLYQPIQGWDAASNVRRAGFAFFGIYGTELNENFAADVAATIPKNKEIIVMCETGGSLDNKPGTQFGFQSRSLKAMYYLQQAGYTKISHMKGGLGDWQRAGLPLADGSAAAPANGRATANGKATASSRNGNGTVNGTAKGSTTAGSSRLAARNASGTTNGTASGGRVTVSAGKVRELVSASSRRK